MAMLTAAHVPFFRPSLTDQEIAAVVSTLKSGWLTTGPTAHRFELEFAAAVGARHAVALNSCTAALHLALEALGVGSGHAVLVPTMTFAATAEVVCYRGATPVLVDCDPVTLNIDMADAERRLQQARQGHLPSPLGTPAVVAIAPVHVAGLMADVAALSAFASCHNLHVVEDAAHAFPAAVRRIDGQWQRCGEGTAAVSCFSFYANKTITTGEGGMAVTEDERLALRMRLMSLHGLSQDAWRRYTSDGSWDYRIMAPGYKYNLTDVAAAIGVAQLSRAEQMRREREQIACRYIADLSDLCAIELPPTPADRLHAWHLFPIKLRLERLRIDRNEFIRQLKEHGVMCSVHWRPLHLHPYYQGRFGYEPSDFPHATAVFPRLVSLPIFPGMRDEEVEAVVTAVRSVAATYAA